MFAFLSEILQVCQLKELKSKLGVAYIFGLRRLVRLFYLSHILCPPQKFICSGLSHIGLGRSTYIFKRGLLRAGGSVQLNSSRVFSNLLNSACQRGQDVYLSWSCSRCTGSRCLSDLSSGTAKKNTESHRRSVRYRCRQKQRQGSCRK